MADWQFRLDFHNFWYRLSVLDTTAEVVIRIKELIPDIRERTADIYQDMADELENDILPLFEELIEEENDDPDPFDNALEALYDWADAPLDNKWGGKKMCWVKTF